MKSIFNTEAYNEILSRLDTLSEESQAKWGKMNVTQMLSHCKQPISLALGEATIKKPNALKRMLFKLISPSLYNDKPWKQGLPTAKEYVIVDTEAFEAEKQALKQNIDKIHKAEDYFKPSKVHPYFGRFTAEQWGKSAYKHLDHHFRQFGV